MKLNPDFFTINAFKYLNVSHDGTFNVSKVTEDELRCFYFLLTSFVYPESAFFTLTDKGPTNKNFDVLLKECMHQRTLIPEHPITDNRGYSTMLDTEYYTTDKWDKREVLVNDQLSRLFKEEGLVRDVRLIAMFQYVVGYMKLNGDDWASIVVMAETILREHYPITEKTARKILSNLHYIETHLF